MRTFFVCSVLLAAMSLAVTQVMAQAGEEGDPVTYTRNEVVYTGVLDPDLDTVSRSAINTLVAGAVVTTSTVAAAVTTTAVGGAALGGGGGSLTTQTGLQSISGYTPPAVTVAPSPSGFSSGSILQPSQIPGYTGNENTDGVSSGSLKLNAAKVIVGTIAGAVVFALM